MLKEGLCVYRKEAYKGFTLFAPLGGKGVHLIDMNGEIVHSWKLPLEIAGYEELLPNGNLLCAIKTPNAQLENYEGCGGGILELSWHGKEVWKYEDPYLHHGFARLSNGNTLVLKWVETPKEIAGKVSGGFVGKDEDGIMWSDLVQEINPNGRVVWFWKAYEHLEPEIDVICPLCFRNRWGEANLVRVTSEDNILLSLKRLSKIVQINKKTGKIDWRFGKWTEFVHQHDFSVLDNGNILIYDSGSHGIGYETSLSKILEFNLKTEELIWQYLEINAVDFFSGLTGNCQRLPNYNTLICEGDQGRIFETNFNNEIVWEYINPFHHKSPRIGRHNMVAHALRYGTDYEGLRLLI